VSLKHVDLVESKKDEGTLLENLELEGNNWTELEDLLDSDFFKQLGEAEENYNDMNIMGKLNNYLCFETIIEYNIFKEFSGDLEPTRDLTSRLYSMFITKDSNVQNAPRQELNVTAERSEEEQSPSSSKNSSGISPVSSAPCKT